MTRVDATEAGVVVQALDGTIVACNAAAEAILGLTADQMRGRSSLDPRWRVVRSDGSPFAGDSHPAMVTLRTGEPQRDVIMGVHKPDGSLTWISIETRAVPAAEGGRHQGVVATFVPVPLPVRPVVRGGGGVRLVPVCAWCKQVRMGDGQWRQVPWPLLIDDDETITHGLCPTCDGTLLP